MWKTLHILVTINIQDNEIVFFCTVLWQMEMGLGTSFREHPVFRFSYVEKFPISLRNCSSDNLSYTNRTTVITIAELGQADKLKISDGLCHVRLLLPILTGSMLYIRMFYLRTRLDT